MPPFLLERGAFALSIRCRTGYSFRVAVGVLPEVMARIVAAGRTVGVITDTANSFGWVPWRKACKQVGLRPVYGVEIAVSPSIEAKKPVWDRWTFLAKDSIRPINELISRATAQFRYQPLLSIEQTKTINGAFKIVGHRTDLNAIEPDENTFVALAPSASPAYLRQALARGFRLIAADDNYYPCQEDEPFYQVLIGRGASSQTYKRFILSDDEWIDEVAWTSELDESILREALATRDAVLAQSTAEIPKGQLLSPDRSRSLRELCIEYGGHLVDLSHPTYAARFEHELNMISSKKFDDYFFIVGDLVRWARQKMTVGPARGSSAGSLVCYMLGITTIDPILHDLIFERFIDVTRDDLPDIDIDFNDSKRDLVFEYMATRYGREHVARLGTVSMFKAAAAINETAAALGIPRNETIPVLESIVKRSSGDIRSLEALGEALRQTPAGKAFLARRPEMEIAARLESHPRHHSQHAAGMVVTDKPVIEYVAVDSRTNAVHCDKNTAEELELLKIDCLGLTQLGIFEQCLSMCGLPHDHLDTIRLDDPEAYAVLNRRQYSGIFQFTGIAVRGVADNIHFENIEDIIAVGALARPGPMGGGATRQWILRRSGQKPVEYPHKSFIPHTKNTYGVIVYQEQVMTLCKDIGEMTWDDVTALRRGMSRSKGREHFAVYGNKFRQGAIKRGIDPSIIDGLWDDICSYGNMCFNRGHSCAYGIVTYQCCWLKAHYPLEFAAATLNHESDPEKQIGLLRELSREGVGYMPIDPEHSMDVWRVSYADNKKTLIGPVQNVHGMGPKLVKQFMSARHRNEPLPPRIEKLLARGKTSLDTLYPIRERIRELLPDPTARNIFTQPVSVLDVLNARDDKTVLIIAVAFKINRRDENEAINVAKRNGRLLYGPTISLNLQLRDDTGQIFAKIDRYDYERIGRPIVELGKAGKAIYAIKGRSWGDDTFRGIQVEMVRYIGDL